MSTALWKLCLSRLEDDLSAQQFNTWIRPLHAVEHADGLTLLAPNRFVRDFVHKEYLEVISSLAKNFSPKPAAVKLDIGSEQTGNATVVAADQPPTTRNKGLGALGFEDRLNPAFTFETHVEGKSNQLARAAASQVGKTRGKPITRCFFTGALVWAKHT